MGLRRNKLKLLTPPYKALQVSPDQTLITSGTSPCLSVPPVSYCSAPLDLMKFLSAFSHHCTCFFPLPAVALPLTFFIAGSLVLRNLNITCWEQPLPLDNPMLRGYFLAHHLIIFRLLGSSSVYLVLFPFLCPFGQSSCPIDLMS